jgi:malonyl-CoA O-methyltransferase
MNTRPGTLDLRHTRRRFDRAAGKFDEVDFVHRRSAQGLMERIGPMVIDANTIVDLGGGTGSATKALRGRFRGSHVILIDASLEMLRQARKKKPFFWRMSLIQCDALSLPLRTGSVDLLYSNLLLPWIHDLPSFFREVSRVLRQGGLFVFSTLGPDSLSALRAAWASVDDGQHVNLFIDMHDVGDGLLHAGLRDPVLDTDYLNVSYRDTAALFRDLTLAGARNSLSGRTKTLTGKDRFRKMESQLRSRFADGVLELTLELVYGHAWGGVPRQDPGEYRIDVGGISRRSA